MLFTSQKFLNVLNIAVPSQLVVAKTLGKKQMLNAICSKIAMQLNCKMGAELWALDIPVCAIQ